MKVAGRMLFVVLLCWMLGAAALAQEAERPAQEGERLAVFLADGSPALLFGIYDLSLSTWQGGIGVLVSSSESFHWRFSLRPLLRSEETDRPDTSFRARSSHQSSLMVTLAPFWVLSRSRSLAITAGPSLGYTYATEEQRSEGSSLQPESVSTFHGHAFSLGADFGVLYAPMESLGLHVEYSPRGSYATSLMEPRATTVSRWDFSSSAAFSLLIRI